MSGDVLPFGETQLCPTQAHRVAGGLQALAVRAGTPGEALGQQITAPGRSLFLELAPGRGSVTDREEFDCLEGFCYGLRR